MTDFERADLFTRRAEGGYVNNPRDPGGETNLGVTKAKWVQWCRANGLPVKAMRDLTRADVTPLYEAWYWKPLAASLPWPLSAAIYDMSVNHGPGDGNPNDEAGDEAGATWMLWKARQLAPKGTPLEQALAACDARESFFRAIVRNRPDQKEFLQGWLNRVNAQRTWLKENADVTTPTLHPVFLQQADETTRRMEEKTTVYNGEQIVRLADGRVQIGSVIVTVFEDRALKLERTPGVK